jgi:hypothetical protein
MRAFLRCFFGVLALATVVSIGALASGTSDASARTLGSHMHGHHSHHGHGHHFRHSFRHIHSHRYHYRHYRHWHRYYRHYRHWHYRHYRQYRHGHWWNRYSGYDRPYYSYRYGRSSGYGDRAPSYSSAPAPRSTEPCNCLTKQYLPDGSILFKDLCTKEEAIARAGKR